MKKFSLRAIGLSPAEKEIWSQAGFTLLSEGVADVAWMGRAPSMETFSFQTPGHLLDQLRPKVFIMQLDTIVFQQGSGEGIYTLKEYGLGANRWLLGTKLEAPLPDDMGALVVEKDMAALAESLYYYLLREVFRETADWCGHMSSVVGRM